MRGFWFDTDKHTGKASFAEQMKGLEPLEEIVRGRTVLDVGCAEGHIGAQCKAWGAKFVHGVENRPAAVEYAMGQIDAVCANAQDYRPQMEYDVVLLLGILNKLPNPEKVLGRMLRACKQTCVIRLSSGQWPMLREFDLGRVAESHGFRVSRVEEGPVDRERGPQWVGYLA